MDNPNENTLTVSGAVASLPPSLLWAAGLSASKDPAKQVLCSIDVRVAADGRIRIVSTDGHRCFRAYVPQSEHYWVNPEQTEPFRINPKAFTKAPSRKASRASFDSSGKVVLLDQADLPVDGNYWTVDPYANGGVYPDTDKVWPDRSKMVCNPGALVAFNSNYVADFCKVTSRLTHNSVVRLLMGESPTTPVIWEAVLDTETWMPCNPEEITLEYLLMPVQIRS